MQTVPPMTAPIMAAPQPMRRHFAARRARRQSGFTLIEILTSVSIILLLLGISIYGYRHLGRSAKDNSTKATLAMLNAYLSELEASTALSSSSANKGMAMLSIPLCTVKAYRDASATGKFPAPAASLTTAVFDTVVNGIADAGDLTTDGGTTGRYGTAVKATSVAMGRLMSLPNVKAAIEKLPDDRFLKAADGAIYHAPADSNWKTPIGGPVLVDAYGNPIIFVPPSGIKNVDRSGVSGATLDIAKDPAANLNYRGPIRGRDDKPFWASAGADGKINVGDDNVYSFE